MEGFEINKIREGMIKRMKEVQQNINNPNDTKFVPVPDGNGDMISHTLSVINGEKIYSDPFHVSLPNLLDSMTRFKARDDDIWLCAYMKSGTHWFNEVVGILKSGKLEHCKEIKENRMIDMFPTIDIAERIPSPRILNSHLLPRFLPKCIFEKGKVFSIMRNPKSVAVSYYYHVKSMTPYGYDGSFSGFLKFFMGDNSSVLAEHAYGAWASTVKQWWRISQENPNVLVIFYEEALKDPIAVFKQIAHHIGVERSDEFFEKMLHLVSMETMSKGHGKNQDDLQFMGSVFKKGTSMYRKGKIDNWKNYFTVAENERFDEYIQEQLKDVPDLLSRLQYE